MLGIRRSKQSDEAGEDSTDPPANRGRPAKSLRARALGYLSRREHSRAELRTKLAPYAEDDTELDPLLDVLQREGWLSDARFAESLLHRRAGRLGAARVLGELKRHGVDASLVEQIGGELRGSEAARARAVWLKRFGGVLPTTPAERAKQARFLAARGFSGEIIGRLFKDDWLSEES